MHWTDYGEILTTMQRASSSPKKILIVRLSSLGDVVLATSAIQAIPSTDAIDWVTAKEFSPILRGHPRIRKLWEFERSRGLAGWLELTQQLWDENYDEVIDLHRTLRTRMLRLVFGAKAILVRKKLGWKTLDKQRWRLYGYFKLKSLWPKRWMPDPVSARSARIAGGNGQERPELSHLLKHDSEFSELQSLRSGRAYLCVMPGAQWPGKRWPVEAYLEALRQIPLLPVILGTASDFPSAELAERLKQEKREHISGVGRWDLVQVAQVLSSAAAYFGNDTGLAHLAEAVGTPAVMVFGPTTPEMGFGPWRPESRVLSASLWCRPCGKDGRFCFRISNRFACMKILSANDALPVLSGFVESDRRSS